MEEFPFSPDDWQRVTDAGNAIISALFMNDEALHTSRIAELQAVLDELRQTYGEHPVLLETEADFLNDVEEQIALYQHARQMAMFERLPTYTIRMSLAKLYLLELGAPGRAGIELLACQEEVAARADEGERAEWQQLWDASRLAVEP
jgi:hypothetical protein